jgi:hypothetical protein
LKAPARPRRRAQLTNLNATDVTMLISNTMSKETAPSQPGESSYPVVVTHARQFLDKIRRTKVLHILKGATTNKLLQKKN